MGKLLGSALRSARKLRKLGQEDVAKAVGVTRQAVGQWERGVDEPSTENLITACEFLGINLGAATSGMVQVTPARQQEDPSLGLPAGTLVVRDRRPELREFEDEMFRLTSPREWPKDVPVLGVAVGGPDADFSMNGEIIDYVRRPPAFARMKTVYAIYVVGSSMSPRFEEGELVYVSESRAPLIGDYVVIEMLPRDEADISRGFLKRLKRRTLSHIVVEQFNPKDEISFKVKEVKKMHRVIPWTEMLG